MNYRKAILLVAAISMVLVAGCSDNNEDPEAELAKETGEDLSDADVGESYWFEVKKTEKNQYELVKRQPPEGMDQSLERQNLKRRYEFLNDQNQQFHVYLLSHGKVVSYFVAQGKVSSVNSKLTNNMQIVRVEGCDAGGNGYSEGSCYKRVESPQMDGSYGTNGAAVFFFTADGRYVEWNGKYIVSQEPLNIQTPVTLTQQVDSGNSTAS